MIEVTKQELANFIREKGDDPINFNEIAGSDSCGCLFIQYAKKIMPEKSDQFRAGLRSVNVYDKETIRFPILYREWCPLRYKNEYDSHDTSVTKFSQLVIPEGL